MQLVTAQDNVLTLSPQVIPGPGTCQSQRTAVNMAMRGIDRAVREVFSTLVFSLDPLSCGNSSWTRVAYLNMSDPLQQCSPPWRLYSANGVRACGRPVTTSTTGGCYSQNYIVHQNYHRVCGRIIGYQVGSPDVFGDNHLSKDEPYVDGVSVTYGVPRKHIWTFAGSLSETIVTSASNHEKYTCPCHLMGQHSECNSHLHLLVTIISVNQEIHYPPLQTQISFATLMIHSGMGKNVKASVAVIPTHLLALAFSYQMSPERTLRYAFVQIKESVMKTLQLDCLRYMCSDRYYCI